MFRSKRARAIVQFLLFCGILLFLNIIAQYFYAHFDLTEEKRFTLTPTTRTLLSGLKERVYVEVLLGGDYPAGFKRLPNAARDMLEDFRSVNGLIDYEFQDPFAGSVKEVNERIKALSDNGIYPTDIGINETGQETRKRAYPTAVFHFGSRTVPVNLIENNSPIISPEVINNSVEKLEYKFASAIKKVLTEERQNILFTKGHGELTDQQTLDLERSLRQFYNTDRIALDSLIQINPAKCALLVIAKPRTAFSEKDKFKIDQYIMGGGRTLWLIDRLDASLDSLGARGRFVPTDYPLNLEDMLFRYGIRIQPDLILDLECTQIPLKVGDMGGTPQFKLFPWYFNPAVLPAGEHRVVKNVDRVELRFCSSIDTIRTKTQVTKIPILHTSRYSRLQFSPVDVNFELLREAPDPSKFNKGSQVTGLLLEGHFPSNYENRVSAEMDAQLKQLGMNFRSVSEPTRMIVISDGDVAANIIRPDNKSWLPLGFNQFENRAYANKDLLLNVMEYLIDPNGLIDARSREVKLRRLDTVKAKKEKTMWQALNIGAPLLLLFLFWLVFGWWRKRKYAKVA
jgi:ABC-2 type transport system permease protein